MTTRYRLYYAPQGSGMSYCGEFETRLEACRTADRSPRGLSEDQWDTARQAGHCGGLTAPPTAGQEDEDPLLWVEDYCIIRVRYVDQTTRFDDNGYGLFQ